MNILWAGGGGRGFILPTANMLINYDASLLSPGSLALWPDTSGNSRDGTGAANGTVVAGASPSGKNVLRLAASAQGYVYTTLGGESIPCSGGFTMYIRYKPTALVGPPQVISQHVVRWYHDQAGDFGTSNVVSATQSAIANYGATVTSAAQTLTFTLNGCGASGTGSVYRDGVLLSSQAYNNVGVTGIGPSTAMYFFRASNGVSGLEADVYQYIWYAGVHDAATRAQAEGALKAKFG